LWVCVRGGEGEIDKHRGILSPPPLLKGKKEEEGKSRIDEYQGRTPVPNEDKRATMMRYLTSK
jgi:hypothetical protein